MATRQNFYAESLTNSTTTSTTYGDKVSVVFTPDASSDYWVFGSCRVVNSSNITADSKVRLFHDTATTVLGEVNIEAKDTSTTAGDNETVFWVKKVSFGASPAEQTISIEFAAETSGNTINCSFASIF